MSVAISFSESGNELSVGKLDGIDGLAGVLSFSELTVFELVVLELVVLELVVLELVVLELVVFELLSWEMSPSF